MATDKNLNKIYRINDRGSYILDWRRPEVGRIRRATGIRNNVQMVRKLRTMMDNLYENGRLDVLRDIQNGVIRPLEAYEFWRTQELEQIPSVATLRPIKPTIPDWIEKHDVADSTRKGYRDHFKQFVNVVSDEVRLLDLPKGLKKYRDHCVQNQTLRAFNYTRSILQAYLNHTFGRHHVLWQQVSHIKPLRIKKQNQAPQLSVVEVVELIRQLPTVHADIVRTMVFTGMGWSEVTGDWSVESDRVVIKGTKTKGRDRTVPLIDPDISRPTRASKAFRTQLRKIRKDVSPYSFRRSYSHWMDEAKIPRIRRMMYMGHGDSDMTDRYERTEVTQFLQEDAELMRDYIFQCWKEKDDEKDEKQLRTIFLFKSKR